MFRHLTKLQVATFIKDVMLAWPCVLLISTFQMVLQDECVTPANSVMCVTPANSVMCVTPANSVMCVTPANSVMCVFDTS